jgi:hypothetical protein
VILTCVVVVELAAVVSEVAGEAEKEGYDVYSIQCTALLEAKGQCHEMDICFEGLLILTSTLCVCADGFQGLSIAFHYPIQLLTLY